MKRRTFLQFGAWLGAASLAVRSFAVPAQARAQSRLSGFRPFDLDEKTIDELQQALASGKSSAVAIAKKYLSALSNSTGRVQPCAR